ncbi:hypothetical protein Tco_0388877, partial [Tanacetum coccineum]
VKTINEEVQLQALVDGKKIIVTEASVRSDFQLNDEEGIDFLPNATIFEELIRMGAKTTAWNDFSSTMAYAIICLAINQKFNFSKYIFESMGNNLDNAGKFLMYPRSRRPKRKDTEVPQPSGLTTNVAYKAVNEEMDDSLVRATTTASSLEAEQDSGNIDKTRSNAILNEPSFLGTSSGSGPRRQETMGDTIAQTRFENVSKTSNDSLLAGVNTPQSDEDRLKLNELMEFCTKLQQRVLDLENTKTAQAQEITSLKLRVKKLEKKGGSRTHKLKRLYKVGRSARVISSDEASLGDQEDASKQGRKIDDIDKDAEITLVHETQGRYGDEEMFDTGVLDGDEVLAEPEVTVKDVNLSVDEVTLAQALAALKTVSTRPRAKGLVIHEEEQATTPTVSSQQPSQVKAQDKGKGIMVEEPVKMKKKDQISLDEELAFKLQAEEEEEEERLAREKAQREEEANIVSWDNVQAMIDADYQMAQQMQAEEQEKLSIEEKSKLFLQLLEARKKHFAAMRTQEKRSKPPTKTQKRKTMSTYLKNMVGYKHNQLKNKSFNDIQKLFGKAIKRVNTFVDMDTELVEGGEVKAKGIETRVKGSSKRVGEELEQESSKKQKLEEDKEIAELQRLIEVIPNKEKWQLMLFLWKLSLQALPKEGYERVLWGDLKTMFDPHVEDQVWGNQQDYRVLDWKLYDLCGVHSLRKQNVHIHMLVEKRYPFTPATITDMLNRKLQADHWNEMCYQLLKLITKQLKNQ